MNSIQKIWIVSLILGFSSFGYAQVLLEDVLAQYVERLGNEKDLQHLQRLKMEQLSYNSNLEIPQTLFIENKKSFYQESIMPIGKFIVAIKNNKGWMVNPYVSNKPVDLSETEQKQFLYQANLLSPLYDYYVSNEDADKIKQVKLLSKTEKVEWDTCYVVLLTYKNDFEEKLYIDMKAFTLRKIKNMLGEVLLSNYKVIGGINFPMYKEFVSTNKIRNKIEIQSITLNPNVDETMFEKPQ